MTPILLAPDMASRKTTLLVVVALVLIAAYISVTFDPRTGAPSSTVATSQTSSSASKTSTETAGSWQTVQLTDVLTGKQFKLSDFRGKPVLVEQMAIWCPLCAQEQDQLQAVQQKLGDKIVIVSVDIDPKETPQALANYATSKGHMWIWSKDPGAVLNFFQLSPPDTPVLVVAPDGTFKLFSGQITTSNEFLQYLQTLGVTG
jgi:thiol-disulfide isomerase/thioredoxin